MTSSLEAALPSQIEELIDRYLLEMARYEKAASLVAERLRRELRAEARLRHMISFRAKHPDDLREKLKLKCRSDDPRYVLSLLRQNLNAVVADLAGCRIVVYSPDDEARVVDLIDRKFQPAPRDDSRPEPYRKERGYRATHRLVLASSSSEDLTVIGAICEVQVATLAAHLFNELEHDIQYKDHGQRPRDTETAYLEDVRRLAEVLDRQVGRLLNTRRDAIRENDVLDTPESLRFALEREIGQALTGDFVRLHRLLETTVSRPSIQTIRDLGDLKSILERGAGEAKRLGVDSNDVDDVVRLALGWLELREEFAQQALSWRGPRTALNRALRALGAAQVDTSTETHHNVSDA